MFALQAINSSTPSDQARISQYQAELQKAQKQASDADSEVAHLQRQTTSAQQDASQAESRLRQLESQAPSTRSASLSATSQLGLYGISLLSGSAGSTATSPSLLSVSA